MTSSTTDITKVFIRYKLPDWIRLKKQFIKLLSDGRVLFVFNRDITWSHFPIGSHRIIFKDLEAEGFRISSSIKVIFEIHNNLKTKQKNELAYFIDAIGHTMLYLSNPKASNECIDSFNYLKDNQVLDKKTLANFIINS